MINVDKARADRAAKSPKKSAPSMLAFGKKYKLPVEMPLDAVFSIRKIAAAQKAKDGVALMDAAVVAMQSLLGDAYEPFMANHPSINDLIAIVEGIPGEYGIGLGNAPASPRSSKTTTTRSKPASKPRTA